MLKVLLIVVQSFLCDLINNLFIMFIVGCWESSSDLCQQSECIAYRKSANAKSSGLRPYANKTQKFCCCTGSNCNNKFTYNDTAEEETRGSQISFGKLIQLKYVLLAIISFQYDDLYISATDCIHSLPFR